MKSPDYTSEFPDELVTRTRGVLRLHLSALMLGDEEQLKFCRYETVSADGQVDGSFHPAIGSPPDSSQWQKIFDRRFSEFEHDWLGMLTAKADTIAKRVRSWLPRERSVGEFLESLHLERILVSHDESVTLRFATSPLLQHHDLGVTFDRRNEIVTVEIEG